MSDEPTLTEAYQQGRDDERAAIFSLSGKPLWVPPDTTATFISAERAVLLDLIAELRTYNTTMGGRLPQSDPDLAALVDRAEAQLRELDTRPQLANERINLMALAIRLLMGMDA